MQKMTLTDNLSGLLTRKGIWLVISLCFFPASLPATPVTFDTTNLPPRTVIEYPALREIPEWVQTNIRIGHLPPADWHMIDEFLKAGYNVVTVNVLTRWDRVGPSASMYPVEEVAEADKYLRRVADTIHKAGARAIFYMGPVQVPWGNERFYKAHPDWVRIRSNGKPDPTINWASIRSGYADWLLEQLAYVTKEYGVDGFWMDGYAPVHLHTYDEATRQKFREFSGGHDIPKPTIDQPDSPMFYDVTKDPIARLYMKWHEDHFTQFADRMRGAIRSVKPDTIIYANNSGNRTWYFPSMYMGEYPSAYSGATDISSVELFWDVPGDPLYEQFVCAFMQCITRDRGSSIWIQPSAHGISGRSTPVEIQLRGLLGLPWGVLPEFVESANREEYKTIHVENMKAREKWLIKSEVLPYIGVVASEQTRSLYAQGALPVYFSHTLGFFKSIFEKHWPVRVLNEYDLEDAELRGVKVLALPNVACLSDRAAEVIRRFVNNGGGLVATYETGLYDSEYHKRTDFVLADLFQAHYKASYPVELREKNLMLTLDKGDHPILNDPLIHGSQMTAWRNPQGAPPEQGPLALVASGAEVSPMSGATVLSTYNLNEPGRQEKRYPAILAAEYGKGKVVYFPASVDKAMFFYPDPYMRQLLANACVWVAGGEAPPVEVEAPLTLTTTFRQQPQDRRLVVHLYNGASSWGMHSIYQKIAPVPEELQKQWGFPNQSELRGTWPIREEIIPLHDIKVTFRGFEIERVHLEPEGLDLPMTISEGQTTVTVPTLNMHSMVVAELKK